MSEEPQNKYNTPWMETEMFLAYQEGDLDYVNVLAGDATQDELGRFADKLHDLSFYLKRSRHLIASDAETKS